MRKLASRLACGLAAARPAVFAAALLAGAALPSVAMAACTKSTLVTFDNIATSGEAGCASITFNGGLLHADGNNTISAPATFGPAHLFGEIDSAGHVFTYAGVISDGVGPSNMTVSTSAGGMVILAGANTYSGGTTLMSNSTLGITNNSSLGTGTLTMKPGSTVDFFANNLRIANNIIFELGEPTFNTGANTVTLTGVISDDSGPGDLTKTGTGTLILTNTETYSGLTTVSAGTLAVLGNIATSLSVTVQNGATLAGTGAVAATDVKAGGTLAPGFNGSGTLTVEGPLTLEAGSFYQIGVSPTAASRSNVIDGSLGFGTATLSGGTVHVLAQSGIYAPMQTYTILTASAGVTGTFGGVTINAPYLSPTLGYDANDVYLTLKITDYCGAGYTRNQCHAGNAVLAGGGALNGLILTQTAAGAQQAFDALSGEIHADVAGQLLEDSRFFREAVLARLFDADNENLPGGLASARGGAMTYFRFADGEEGAPQPLAYLASLDPASPIRLKKPPLAASVPGPDLTIWAQGLGAWGETEGDGNAATLSRSLGGLFTGFDERFGQVRAGLAAGYLNSTLDLSARASAADINSAHFGGYAGTSLGALHVRGGAEYVFSAITTDRSIAFPGFTDQTSANYTANEAQVFGEIAYGVRSGALSSEPFLDLAFVHVGTGGFAETGGLAALNAPGSSSDIGYSTLGTRIAGLVILPNGVALTPWGSLGWQHAIGAVTPSVALAFATTGAGFGVEGVPLARDAALIQLGADLRVLPQATVGLSYSGLIAATANDQALKGTFTWQF